MKNLIFLFFIVLFSCDQKKEMSSINPENWKDKEFSFTLSDSLESGSTYLSVYSQIYGKTEHRTYDLTATISMRNINRVDTVYIEKAEYYNTKGDLIRSYFKNPIFLGPLETVEIVIDEKDQEGGTGANFVFDWKMKKSSTDPFFESIMISTSGPQGVSFTTHGIRINN